MPNRNKQKGDRFERSIVHEAEMVGLKAYRIPLSGQTPDLHYDVMVAGRTVQCKKEASGFKRIREWMEGVDAVVVGSDYEESLVIIRLNEWLKLL